MITVVIWYLPAARQKSVFRCHQQFEIGQSVPASQSVSLCSADVVDGLMSDSQSVPVSLSVSLCSAAVVDGLMSDSQSVSASQSVSESLFC